MGHLQLNFCDSSEQMEQLSYYVENCRGLSGTENVKLESILFLFFFFFLLFHHLARETEMTFHLQHIWVNYFWDSSDQGVNAFLTIKFILNFFFSLLLSSLPKLYSATFPFSSLLFLVHLASCIGLAYFFLSHKAWFLFLLLSALVTCWRLSPYLPLEIGSGQYLQQDFLSTLHYY